MSIATVGNSFAGFPYILTCTASIVPYTVILPHIRWIDPLNNTVAVTTMDRSLELIFDQLTLSAQGQYTCRVTISFDSLEQMYTGEISVLVDVQGKV